MRKTIFILALALLLALPASLLAGGYYKEVKCDICGKLLREWVGTSDGDSDYFKLTGDNVLTVGTATIDWSVTTEPTKPKPLEKALHFAWSDSLTLCPICKKKYADQLKSLLITAWDKFLAEAIEANEDRAKLMQEQAKEYRIQALRKELSDFKRDIKEKLEEINKIKEETK